MPSIGQAIITVDADPSPMERRIKAIQAKGITLNFNSSRPLGRLTGDVAEFEKSMSAANARVLAFGASAAVIGSVGIALRSMVEQSISVEKSLAQINSTLGASQSNLKQFGDNLFNIAKNTGQTFEDAAKTAAEFSRQNLTVAETLKRTNDALILARTSGEDYVSIVKDLTAVTNAFSREGATTTDIVNRLTAVSDRFGVSTKDLTEGISSSAEAADQAKVSLNQLIALITRVQQTTSKGGAEIAVAFNTIFSRVQKKDTLESLDQLGVSVRNIQGQTLPAIEILNNLAQTFDKLGDSQKQQAAELIGGTRQIAILKTSLGDLNSTYSRYNSILDTANNATDEAAKRNASLNKTVAASANEALQNLEKLSAAAGSLVFGPSLKRILGGINAGSDALNGESTGKSFGESILRGIGNALSGPGLLAGGFLAAKLFKGFSEFALKAAGNILEIGKASEKQLQVQNGVNALLEKTPGLYEKILIGAISRAEIEERTLKAIQDQIAAESLRTSFLGNVSEDLANSGVRYRQGKGFSVPEEAAARGYIPNFSRQAEINEAARQGYSVQPDQVRHMVAKIDGKTSNVTYNSRERVIQNFANTGEPAIIPPGKTLSDLIQEKSNKASGFIPNLASRINPEQLELARTIAARISDLPLEMRQIAINSIVGGSLNFGVPKSAYNGQSSNSQGFGLNLDLPSHVGAILAPKAYEEAGGGSGGIHILDRTANIRALAKKAFQSGDTLFANPETSSSRGRVDPFSSKEEIENYLIKNLRTEGLVSLAKRIQTIPNPEGGRDIKSGLDLQIALNKLPIVNIEKTNLGGEFRSLVNARGLNSQSLNRHFGEITDEVVTNAVNKSLGYTRSKNTGIELPGNLVNKILGVDLGSYAPGGLDAKSSIDPYNNTIRSLLKKGNRTSEGLESFNTHLGDAIGRQGVTFQEQSALSKLLRRSSEAFLADGFIPNLANFISEGSNDYEKVRGIDFGKQSLVARKNTGFSPLGPTVESLKKQPARYTIGTKSGSYLDFTKEGENFDIKYIKSLSKGEGTELFSKLKDFAKKRGAGILSDDLVSQKPGHYLTNENLNELFPQLRIREKLGLERTSGVLTHINEDNENDSIYFGSLTDLRKQIGRQIIKEPNIGQLESRFGKGFIPNLVNQISGQDAISYGLTHSNSALRDSIARETNNTGVSLSQVRVNFGDKVGLPSVSVTNTRDEGLRADPNIGFSRVKAQGGDPFLAGSGREFGHGFIPNYEDVAGDIYRDIQRRDRNGDFKSLEAREIAKQDAITRVMTEKRLSGQLENISDYKRYQNKLNRSLSSYENDASNGRFVASNDAPISTSRRSSSIGGIQSEGGFNAQHAGFAISFAAPLIGGAIAANLSNPQAQRGVEGVSSAIGSGALLASIGGKAGPIIGTLVGGIGALKSIIDNLKPSFEDLSKVTQDLAAKKKDEITSVSAVIQAQGAIEDLRKNGGTPTQIGIANTQLNTALSGIADSGVRSQLLNAKNPEDQEKILANIQQQANKEVGASGAVASAAAFETKYSKGISSGVFFNKSTNFAGNNSQNLNEESVRSLKSLANDLAAAGDEGQKREAEITDHLSDEAGKIFKIYYESVKKSNAALEEGIKAHQTYTEAIAGLNQIFARLSAEQNFAQKIQENKSSADYSIKLNNLQNTTSLAQPYLSDAAQARIQFDTSNIEANRTFNLAANDSNDELRQIFEKNQTEGNIQQTPALTALQQRVANQNGNANQKDLGELIGLMQKGSPAELAANQQLQNINIRLDKANQELRASTEINRQNYETARRQAYQNRLGSFLGGASFAPVDTTSTGNAANTESGILSHQQNELYNHTDAFRLQEARRQGPVAYATERAAQQARINSNNISLAQGILDRHDKGLDQTLADTGKQSFSDLPKDVQNRFIQDRNTVAAGYAAHQYDALEQNATAGITPLIGQARLDQKTSGIVQSAISSDDPTEVQASIKRVRERQNNTVGSQTSESNKANDIIIRNLSDLFINLQKVQSSSVAQANSKLKGDDVPTAIVDQTRSLQNDNEIARGQFDVIIRNAEIIAQNTNGTNDAIGKLGTLLAAQQQVTQKAKDIDVSTSQINDLKTDRDSNQKLIDDDQAGRTTLQSNPSGFSKDLHTNLKTIFPGSTFGPNVDKYVSSALLNGTSKDDIVATILDGVNKQKLFDTGNKTGLTPKEKSSGTDAVKHYLDTNFFTRGIQSPDALSDAGAAIQYDDNRIGSLQGGRQKQYADYDALKGPEQAAQTSLTDTTAHNIDNYVGGTSLTRLQDRVNEATKQRQNAEDAVKRNGLDTTSPDAVKNLQTREIARNQLAKEQARLDARIKPRSIGTIAQLADIKAQGDISGIPNLQQPIIPALGISPNSESVLGLPKGAAYVQPSSIGHQNYVNANVPSYSGSLQDVRDASRVTSKDSDQSVAAAVRELINVLSEHLTDKTDKTNPDQTQNNGSAPINQTNNVTVPLSVSVPPNLDVDQIMAVIAPKLYAILAPYARSDGKAPTPLGPSGNT